MDLTPDSHPSPLLPAARLPDVAILAGLLRPSSRAIYTRDIAAYVAWCQTAERAPTVPANLAAWRAHLAEQTDLAPATINRMISAVKRLAKEAGQQGLLSADLALGFAGIVGVQSRALKERSGRHAGTLITPKQMRALCDAPDPTTLHGLRDRALLHTLATSAVRIAEACHLRRQDIHATGEGYMITVTGKTDVEPRQAPLSREAYRLIHQWLAVRALDVPYIFTRTAGQGHTPRPEPLTVQAAWALVQKYAIAAKLTNVKPHDFRRAVLTDATARLGIRVAQKIAGHKNIATTARYDLQPLAPGLTDDWY